MVPNSVPTTETTTEPNTEPTTKLTTEPVTDLNKELITVPQTPTSIAPKASSNFLEAENENSSEEFTTNQAKSGFKNNYFDNDIN